MNIKKQPKDDARQKNTPQGHTIPRGQQHGVLGHREGKVGNRARRNPDVKK